MKHTDMPFYDFSLEHVNRLKMRCHTVNLSIPDGFFFTSVETLRTCYNGIGPDQWSSCFRKWMTFLLHFLEASALIHDWEYTFQPKTYTAFSIANLRLMFNAIQDNGHFLAGLFAAILCQLFGWHGYKNNNQFQKKESL